MTDRHTWSTLFGCLRARAQCRLLTVLAIHEQMATTRLSETLVTETPAETTSQTAWVNIHLPILAKANYLDWDTDEATISQGSRFDETRAVLPFAQTGSEVELDG